MYAVVNIKGFQYKLEKGEKLNVPKYDVEVGKKIKIPEVLLISDGEIVSVGTPYVEGAVVEATVTAHDKYKKIIVFKKKKRKDYSVKRGHRQEFTEIIIDRIKISKAKAEKKVSETKEAPQKAKAVTKPKPEKEEKMAVKAVAKSKVKAETVVKTKKEPKPIKESKPAAKPKAAAKPKPAAKPKAAAKPKPAAKPKAAKDKKVPKTKTE